MKKYKLNIQVPLLIKSYLPISIISSIACANQGNNSWIVNNFIQLFIPKDKKKLESFPFQDFMYYDQSLFQINDVNDNNFIFSSDKMINDIVFWIDHHNYVVVYIDEYEIPGTRNYQKKHILHSQLIYGYDVECQQFLIINFLQNNTIGEITVDFEVLVKAMFMESTKNMFLDDNISWNNRNTVHKVILIRYLVDREKYYDHGINKKYILNELYNYCFSINSSNNTCFFTGKLSGTWGIAIYSKIIGFIKEKPDNLDYRIFHLLYEHKAYMSDRLKLFEEHNEYSAGFTEVTKASDVLRMMCIKYNHTKNNKILDRMVGTIETIRDNEKQILLCVLNDYGYNVKIN